MKQNFKTLFLFCLLFSSSLFADNKFLFTGSSTVAPLVAELARSFEKQHSNYKIEVQTGGSAKGINDCQNQLNDYGMISRELKKEEKNIKVTPIARDGLAFITHKENNVRALSTQQVIDIFTGKISNWSQLGGKDEKIFIMSKAEGRAALELFLSYTKLKNSQIKANVIIGDEEQGIKTIASTKNSIGFLSISTVENALRAKLNIASIALDGQMPSSTNVRNKTYKISRYLNLIECKTNKDLSFVNFIISKEGQSLVEKYNFIPL